jgi:hypothetical protein
LPDTLVDPGQIPGNFLWRQRLVARYGEDTFEFEAVVEKSTDSLRVLFLTPYGTRALLLEQVGHDVRTQYFISHRLPFPPRYILSDMHRVFFRGFAPGAPNHGRHAQLLAGEFFEDTWETGTLVARTVQLPEQGPRASAAQSRKISIRYTPGFRPGSPPARIRLNNQWHGYDITIDTLAQP